MTEAAGRVPIDIQQAAQVAIDQQRRTRDTLVEIAGTGNSSDYGDKVFHWLLLGFDNDDEGLSEERDRIFSELGAELEMAFGAEGRQEVARAIAGVAVKVRDIEMASNYW
ncbi:MAG: hypothetical protein HYT09_00980 [Candidatus Levybacteria bacterium]|nr:hypothetical protein [Candidatus Levybacteria bacterium]